MDADWGAPARVLLRPGRAVLFAASAVIVGAMYSVLLPFGITQRISLANWRFLTPGEAALSVAIAFLTATVITLQVHAARAAVPCGGKGATAAGMVGGLLPSVLCCTSVVPALVGLTGASTMTVFAVDGAVQGFFASYATYFLIGGVGLLAVSAGWTANAVATGAPACQR